MGISGICRMEGDGGDGWTGSLEACLCGEAETCWECSKASLEALFILAMLLFIVLSLSESSGKGLAGTDGVYNLKSRLC